MKTLRRYALPTTISLVVFFTFAVLGALPSGAPRKRVAFGPRSEEKGLVLPENGLFMNIVVDGEFAYIGKQLIEIEHLKDVLPKYRGGDIVRVELFYTELTRYGPVAQTYFAVRQTLDHPVWFADHPVKPGTRMQATEQCVTFDPEEIETEAN